MDFRNYEIGFGIELNFELCVCREYYDVILVLIFFFIRNVVIWVYV